MSTTYDHYTVKELKELVKERKAFVFDCKKKADYIKALQDKDAMNQSLVSLQQYGSNMKKQIDEIAEAKQKVRDAISKADEVIAMLKAKENKGTEDYEKIISLYEKKIGLMKFI